MIVHTCEATVESLMRHTRKSSVWRDGLLGLAASLSIGLLTGALLTIVVFTMVTITTGQ